KVFREIRNQPGTFNRHANGPAPKGFTGPCAVEWHRVNGIALPKEIEVILQGTCRCRACKCGGTGFREPLAPCCIEKGQPAAHVGIEDKAIETVINVS